MAQSISELQMARDTLIFLFQHLGLVINLKKSVLTACQNIIFRLRSGLNRNVLDTPTRESSQSETEMLPIDQTSSNNTGRYGQSLRSPLLDSTSCSSSLSSNALPPTSVYPSVQTESKSALPLCPERKQYSGTGMVDEQFRALQWEVSSKPFNEDSDSNRRIKKRLGSLLPKPSDRGALDPSGKWKAHKCAGIDGHSPSFIDL